MSRSIRAFIEQSPIEVGEEIFLPENEAVHLSRVLRIRPGDKLECLDGKGGKFSGECLEVDRSLVRVRVVGCDLISPHTSRIRMVIALSKGNKWDELIRPLCELGVSRLTPLISERTEGAFSLKKFEEKKDRWRKIAQEACKQSGNPWVPTFDHPTLFADALSLVNDGEHCWFGSLNEGVKKLSPLPDKKTVAIFIGPEGGWTEEEEDFARKEGLSFFRLSPHVLRVETAAVSALAVARQSLLC